MTFDDFKQQVSGQTTTAVAPSAIEIHKNVPIYDGAMVRDAAGSKASRAKILLEWANIFLNGPGVLAIRGAMQDLQVVDRATQVFEHLIDLEKNQQAGGGDHFAKPGSNDRVWNAVEKHCMADPVNFASYYASDGLAMAAEAWLGPAYQMTAQVNRVNPGGTAQVPHRDYHLGFMTAAQIDQYPDHIHQTSAQLTLQGAVAHCDMPLETGPTHLLPFSQKFEDGYRRFGDKEFQDYFAENFVQLPLQKGDALFFNPALMHGAGNNTSKDIFRMANLLQISSAFGIAMENLDRTAMCKKVFPVLKEALKNGTLSDRELENVIGSTAFGYPFPTNLDTDPPSGGLAPKTQSQRLKDALTNNLSEAELSAELDAYNQMRLS